MSLNDMLIRHVQKKIDEMHAEVGAKSDEEYKEIMTAKIDQAQQHFDSRVTELERIRAERARLKAEAKAKKEKPNILLSILTGLGLYYGVKGVKNMIDKK